MFENLNIPEEAKSKEFKEIENNYYKQVEKENVPCEILINKAEFDAAMKKVAEDLTNDPKLEGMSKLLMPLTGMTFAAKMAEILFPNTTEEKNV